MVYICWSSITPCIRYWNVRMEEATDFLFLLYVFYDMLTPMRLEVSWYRCVLNKIICYYSYCISGCFYERLSHFLQFFGYSFVLTNGIYEVKNYYQKSQYIRQGWKRLPKTIFLLFRIVLSGFSSILVHIFILLQFLSSRRIINQKLQWKGEQRISKHQ